MRFEVSMVTPVCAILPTQLRRREVLGVLERIYSCDPVPAEVRVHVNGGARECVVTEAEILARFPRVILSRSEENLGPGGARNHLIEASGCEYVAGFDDDSHPIDGDYFARVEALFGAYPEATILSAEIFHRGEQPRNDERRAYWAWDYIGCGCAYRRSRFLAAGGHVVRWVPYTIEEPDLCLRIVARNERVLHTGWLRVLHDTTLSHHSDPRVNGGALANVALAAWVRYPAISLWRAPFQVARRFVFCAGLGRWAGLFAGLVSIPALLWRHRTDRRPVSPRHLRRFLKLRGRRDVAPWQVGAAAAGHCAGSTGSERPLAEGAF